MIPTFDWSNLLRGIIRRGIGFGAYNPITLFLAFAATLASLASAGYQVINSLYGFLPELLPLDLVSIFSRIDSDSSGVFELICYLTNLRDFVFLIQAVFSVVNALVVWIPTFLISLLAAILIFRFSHTVRSVLIEYCG